MKQTNRSVIKLNYTPLAKADLRDILTYGQEHWGANAAYDFVVGLETEFKLFLQNPQAGRIVENPFMSPTDGEHRTFAFGNYQVYYEVQPSILLVHAIIPKHRPLA